jgi:hypothetical protein
MNRTEPSSSSSDEPTLCGRSMAKPELRPEAFSPASPASISAIRSSGAVLGEATRGGQPGVSGAEHDPVHAAVAFQRRFRRARRQQTAPAVDAVVLGQTGDLHEAASAQFAG